ncbi:PREDICTED: replication protein A 32 kDa subunit-like [Priapulus caudatus]|uniref:Replication protein A 32 kDa subunit-like n=1 Tax=Priapulus caudatus TaxID=37621 RepID=A0ABM1DUJ0_PRICU|nr:PREDICTED: replication protein A 32 kDa subunit-like [Priapulus caudatus]
MDVHQVTIVGLVRSVKEQTTNITYELDDMSGPPLEVKHWLDNSGNAASDQTKPIVEYTYVRVHGNIRNFQGKKTVVAFRITELDDLNELTSHILEVCHNHLHHSVHKGKPGSMGEPAAVGQMNTGTGFQGNVDSGGYAGAMPQNGLSNVQQQDL